jgi:Flp pilus assembly protein TadG
MTSKDRRDVGRSSARRAGHGGRGRDQRGSVLAETAIISPLLVLLLLGIFEFGMAWRESLNNSSAARAAARTSTNLGNQRSADWGALTSFNATMARKKNITVNRVVIYATTAPDGSPSNAACLTTIPAAGTPSGGFGITGACNIYNAAQLAALGSNYLTNFNYVSLVGSPAVETGCTAASWDHWWCPTNRKANQGDPPDYVGVYVNFTYKSWTGLLPTTITMTERVVMRIEPKVS